MKVKVKKGEGDKNLNILIEELSKNLVSKVGWFPNLKYEDGTFVAAVAEQNEFGVSSKSIPPRPFMRPTISQKSGTWREKAIKMAERAAKNKATANDFFDVIGQQAAGNVRETIKSIQTPALRPSTIRARQAKKPDKQTLGLLTKPLVDTGTMLNTVTSRVEKK